MLRDYYINIYIVNGKNEEEEKWMETKSLRGVNAGKTKGSQPSSVNLGSN